MVWYLHNNKVQYLNTANTKFHPPLNSFLHHYSPVHILKAVFSEVLFDKFDIFQLSESLVTLCFKGLKDLHHQSLVFLLCSPRGPAYVRF